jgi:hypothetical protein
MITSLLIGDVTLSSADSILPENPMSDWMARILGQGREGPVGAMAIGGLGVQPEKIAFRIFRPEILEDA